MGNGNKPIKKFSAGAISVAVWKNTMKSGKGQEFDVESISIQRRYKDTDGDWKNTTSFRVNDVAKLQLLLSKAYEYLVTKQKDEETTEEAVD